MISIKSKMLKKFISIFLLKLKILLFVISISACQILGFSYKIKTAETVNLPFIKNTASECYYLDEFMPTPDNIVAGKSGSISLRYYIYKAANYKNFQNKNIVLAFYSTDDRCWSLFEEYYADIW